MWSHLAEQLRAKPMGYGAARQPKGCSKEVNKGLPAALPGLQEPGESPARQCGGRSKSWFVSRKNMCPVKFHLGRSSKVNGWELVSLQWRAWQKSDKNNGYFSSQKLFPGRAPWFWHVLQCSVLWQEPVFLDLQPSTTRGRGLKCWQISVSGMSQSKRYFWLNPERSESDPHLTQPQGWLCLRLQCESASKGKSCSLLPWKGCWEALLITRVWWRHRLSTHPTENTFEALSSLAGAKLANPCVCSKLVRCNPNLA